MQVSDDDYGVEYRNAFSTNVVNDLDYKMFIKYSRLDNIIT